MEDLGAGLNQSRAAKGHHGKARALRAQVTHEGRGMLVARVFAGDHKQVDP